MLEVIFWLTHLNYPMDYEKKTELPKTKEDFTPRFAHHNADTFDYATETAINIKAKEIIENVGENAGENVGENVGENAGKNAGKKQVNTKMEINEKLYEKSSSFSNDNDTYFKDTWLWKGCYFIVFLWSIVYN